MVTLSPDAPNPIGAMTDPEPQEKTKPRPNRNVSAPGSRGGHYRRIWSNKLHKFYIKYGKSDGSIDVDETDSASAKIKPDTKSESPETLNNVPLPSRIDKDATEELLNGLYEELLRSYQMKERGTGRHHGGHAVTFGRVTPANGEIVFKHEHGRSCYLYDDKGNTLRHMTRQIRSDQKLKEFFCYMVARYAIEKFMDGKKEQTSKSLMLSRQKGSSVLKKAYADVLASKVAQATPRPDPKPAVFSELIQNLEQLRDAHKGKEGPTASATEQRLMKANKYLDRLEKAGPKEMWNRTAPASAGKRYGSAGGGRMSVFRLPGRPQGSGQGLTIASGQGLTVSSASMPASAGVTGSPKDSPASDKDWKNDRHLRVGARVKVQHPYEHIKPTWATITDIGDHGVQVTDHEGNVTNIRWEHIHELQPIVSNNPANAYEVARFKIPVHGVSGPAAHQLEVAEKELRKLAMPMGKDVIHSGHDDKTKAYVQLLADGYPIDDLIATRGELDDKGAMRKLTEGLVSHAVSMKIPVNPEVMRELPFNRVISIIHHHLNNKKDGTDE